MRTKARGQVLPMWALGIITTFALMFLALNYGNAIRWQIRAQNAADSAANAVISIQAQRWNVMTATLYATSVEEYRARRLLDSLLLTIDQSGGCKGSLYPKLPDNVNPDPLYKSLSFYSCNRVYMDLRLAYLRSVTRYGNDVNDLNSVATLATYTGFKNDATSLLQTLQACSTVVAASPGPTASAATPAPAASFKPTCGDTSFKYSFAPQGIAQQTNLNNVSQDAQQWQIAYDTSAAPAIINPELFAPVKIDIVTCAIVPAILPNFGPMHFKPYYAIGRAAAANVMVEQDWLQPGSIVDPQRLGNMTAFQPVEPVTAPAPAPTPAYNWYGVDFGGESNTAYVNSGAFGFQFVNDDFEAQVGWWGGIPIRPFGGTVTLTGSQGAC